MTVGSIRHMHRKAIAVVSFALASIFAAGVYSFVPPLFSSLVPSDLVYFQGKWTVTIKGDAASVYTWTVTDDLKGEWLTGVVEKGGDRLSTDHWRLIAGRIERYVFTSEGSSIKLVSSGWKTGKMIFNGIASGKALDFRIRETITRETDTRFRTVWEKQGDDGKWIIFAEETLSK